MMRSIYVSICALSCAMLLLLPAAAWGHGTPIDISIDGNDKVHAHVGEHGELTLVLGSWFTTMPGVGVSSAANGLVNGDPVRFDVLRELLYYNGTTGEVTAPSAATTLFMENPAGSTLYEIDGSSGVQTGMLWGAYNGTPGWHSHGAYELELGSDPAGAYGIVLRALVDGHEPSDPFLLAFNRGLTHSAFNNTAVPALMAAMVPEPATWALALPLAGLALAAARRRVQAQRANV